MSDTATSQVRYAIGAVARRTGLQPGLLRAWERRYSAVVPRRTETNRRYYTEDDIRKLLLLKRALGQGHRIAEVANLSIAQLQQLVPAGAEDSEAGAPRSHMARRHLNRCLSRVEAMDPVGLRRELTRASLRLRHEVLLDEVLAPMIRDIGDSWECGQIGVAHEHVATVVVATFLEGLREAIGGFADAPRILLATLSGHRHELGALLAAASAAAENWQVIYAGADLPAAEIVRAARQRQVQAVGISLVYSGDGAETRQELRELRTQLESGIPLLLGGSLAPEFKKTVEGPSVWLLEGQQELRSYLAATRAQLSGGEPSSEPSGAE